MSNFEYTPDPRGYTMSEQDKAAIVGKAVMEHAEVSKSVEMLRARLQEIGGQHQTLARALRDSPERLIAVGESYDARFAPGHTLVHVGNWVDLASTLELARQLRAAIVRQSELDMQLTRLGVSPR